ncbi:MAG: CpXC domain-containing protein [Anaerolineaceae bacterium]
MPKTLINCPNCKKPLQADIIQLFDVGAEPALKQLFLSGGFNIAQCPFCGFQGNLAVPIVYHDPEKELLLTFVPPEIGLPRDEQEKAIGVLINQAVNKLPPEKRKAYLFQPQTVLTLQGLVERVLEADGITREMLQAQQKKISLIQQLLRATPEKRKEIAAQEDQNLDAEFFGLLNRLIETTIAGGDQEGTKQLVELQKNLLSATSFGKILQEQTQEVEAAIASLKEAGKDLTLEKLVDIVIHAPNDNRLKALVSLTRPAMDYMFFQALSEKIDRARDDGRKRLIDLRERLLELLSEYDKQVEIRVANAKKVLDSILQASNLEESLLQSLPAIDEFFIQELNTQFEAATKQGDEQKSQKIKKIVDVLQQISTPPPEYAFIEELLDAEDDDARKKILDKNRDKVTPDFVNAMTTIATQAQSSDDKELAEKIQALYRLVIKYSMEAGIQTN